MIWHYVPIDLACHDMALRTHRPCIPCRGTACVVSPVVLCSFSWHGVPTHPPPYAHRPPGSLHLAPGSIAPDVLVVGTNSWGTWSPSWIPCRGVCSCCCMVSMHGVSHRPWSLYTPRYTVLHPLHSTTYYSWLFSRYLVPIVWILCPIDPIDLWSDPLSHRSYRPMVSSSGSQVMWSWGRPLLGSRDGGGIGPIAHPVPYRPHTLIMRNRVSCYPILDMGGLGVSGWSW